MKKINITIGKLFLVSALVMLLLGLFWGILASIVYVKPDFLKSSLGFISLRPLHVTSVMFWIILGATGCVYSSLDFYTERKNSNNLSLVQWLLWIVAICAIVYSYFTHQFGGREYWEFNPMLALPIALAWLLFIVNFFSIVKKLKNWPVYMWMWMTGIIFFLFTYAENYLWIFSYFRGHFITDMTIQWKVNGSLVGAWNQILYGTAFYLMDKIKGTKSVGSSKIAFAMYFLGLFNLMFNWGHHIYTMPTEKYIRLIGYGVSMTEWVFFIKILYTWKKSITEAKINAHYFPYKFLIAADFWVFINMGQAILMSIPAINKYTHGTHITVAHSMGTTIGINTMILFAACFEYLTSNQEKSKWLTVSFWTLQISLLVFLLSLNVAGIQKAIWQMKPHHEAFSVMQDSLKPYFVIVIIAGTGILVSLYSLVINILFATFKKK